MSIQVRQIVLHQLVRKENEQDEAIKLETILRQASLPISSEVEQMMLQLHQVYQNKSKSYGVFMPSSRFAQSLNQWLEQELDFLPFSCNAAKSVALELEKYPFAHDGTFVMCQYNFLATEYLFIALLDSRASILVDEHLELHSTQYLDITQFDIVARINLTELQINAQSNRYLTYAKGRVGRKVCDFFMDFLEAEEGLNPQLQNQCLLQAVSDYCGQSELSQEQTQTVKKQVFDYCKTQLNSGEEIVLTELSDNLPVFKEQSFVEFTTQQDYELEEKIPPVRSTLKHLAKFSGTGKGVSISFDAELLHQRIIWDEENDTLTIKGLPPNLKDQLKRQLKV